MSRFPKVELKRADVTYAKETGEAEQPQNCERVICRIWAPLGCFWVDIGDPLALFTAVLAISAIGLWYITWRTLDHAQADATRQASDTQKALVIAGKQADAALEQARQPCLTGKNSTLRIDQESVSDPYPFRA